MSQSGRVELLKKNQTQRPEQRLDIFTKIKFKNGLPDIPMEPRFFQLPFIKLSRFAEYKTTDMEKNYRFELTTERDLDINVDLINTKKYEAVNETDLGIPENMDPADKFLVEDESKQSDKRRANHNEVISWMRKTQYLGIDNVRFGVGADRQETKIGYKMMKTGINDELYKDREGQLKAINKTFEDAKRPCKAHPTKPGVVAVEEFPVLPDFDAWHLPYAQVLIDGDPIPFRKEKEKIMERAVIQGAKDSQGTDFVAYYVPIDETLNRLLELELEGKTPDKSEQLEYKLAREFNWTIKNENSKGYEPYYFFAYRGGVCYYNDMNTRVKLTRKQKGSGAAETMHVHNDEVTENEKVEFEKRLHRLADREILVEEPEPEPVVEEVEEKSKKDSKLNDIFGDDEGEESSASSDGDSDSDEEEDKKDKKKESSSSSSSEDND